MPKRLFPIVALFVFVGVGCQSTTPPAMPVVEIPCTAASLRAQLPRIERYLASVESQILSIAPEIPGMHQYDWRSMLARQSQEEEFYSYGAPLWLESDPDGMILLEIRCNVLCLDQMSAAAIGPTFSIPDSQMDVRLDWFVNTGQPWLDEEVQRIVQETYATDFALGAGQ